MCNLTRFFEPIISRQLGNNRRIFIPETLEGSGAALVLSAHKSTRHD